LIEPKPDPRGHEGQGGKEAIYINIKMCRSVEEKKELQVEKGMGYIG
jgi:hypothetical protein